MTNANNILNEQIHQYLERFNGAMITILANLYIIIFFRLLGFSLHYGAETIHLPLGRDSRSSFYESHYGLAKESKLSHNFQQ